MLTKFFPLIFVSFVFAGAAHAAAPQCASIFADKVQPTIGSDLGPIEMVRNLKQKFFPSQLVKNFDQKSYSEAVETIKTQDLRVENGFRPESLEQAIAYLDVQLESLSISINSMPPVLRHKIYKTVTGVLKSQGRNADSEAQGLANLIFRGSYVKPTSFFYILTHIPTTSGREMFIQHLHALEVTDIVAHAYDYNPGPKRPSMVVRNLPPFVKEHREIITSALWGGFSIYATVSAHSLDSMFLPAFNVFKLKQFKIEIEQAYLENGLEATLQSLNTKYEKIGNFNFVYSAVEKGMAWYFVGSLLTIFSGP